jgi:glycosyltransferase involved in cell wall biosynthesis
MIRIITFNNPFKEIHSFYHTRKINQIDLRHKIFYHNELHNFSSSLVNESPLVSIILPTLNRYAYLFSLLNELEKQTYENFEVIIIDQSSPYRAEVFKDFNLKLKIIHQKERALWKARNLGIKESNGDFILMLDDDSSVEPNWIIEHLKCIDFFNVDISAGVSISLIGNPIPDHYKYHRWADQLDTGNVLIKRKIFRKCGLFDLQFEGMRMGDDEFGVRAYINGFKSISNPLAKREHLKVAQGGLREMGSWDGMRPVNWIAPRPIPSIIYHFRKYWGNYSAILFLVKNIPLSLSNYTNKGNRLGYGISLVQFIFFLPILVIQVLWSWAISSKKLAQGDQIKEY